MAEPTVIQLERPAAKDLPRRNGKGLFAPVAATTNYSLLSTVKQLPGSSTILSTTVTGEELGRLFTEQPDLAGVILFEQNRFVNVISQTHYYKCISRAFGREIYHRRPSSIMLKDIAVDPLVLVSDCSIQTAVERCLARPSDYIYEPFIVHTQETGEYRLCSVQDLLMASSQLAALRNQQMELILNSVTDGLLVIDKNFRIGGEYSKVVGKIFERPDLRDVSLPEVLRPLIDSVTYENLMDYLKILFDPKLIDRLIKTINPAKQISANFTSSGPRQQNKTKHFALSFERIRTQAEISQVLVQIEDITSQINLAIELAKQEAAAEEKLNLVMQILQVEPVSLNRYIAHFDEGIADLHQTVENPPANEDPRQMIHVMFRKAHTLKGEAGVLRLGAHERLLHKLEDELDKLRSSTDLTAADFKTLAPALEPLLELGEQIHQVLEQVKTLATGTKTQAQSSPEANAQVAQPAPVASDLMETLSRMVSEISQRLDKPVAFHTMLKSSDLPQAYAEMLPDVLMHLIRNSMVHGIESREERAASGKNATGVIQLDLRDHPDFHELIFQDDGAGLNLEKIRARAAQLGWNLPTDDLLHLAIFEPGFSTADTVSDLAGRGVGLDAIRDAIRQVGGRIIPHSQAGAYCAFQILLPKITDSPAV